VRWTSNTARSIRWVTFELELEQLSEGEPGSAAGTDQDVWMIGRRHARGRDPNGVRPTSEFAHEQSLASARWIELFFDTAMPAALDVTE
jgi:hypothetical protein